MKYQIRLLFKTGILPSLIFIFVVPIFVSIRNLNSTGAAFVLEKFVSLIGIILFIPIVSIDLNNHVIEITQSKSIRTSNLLYLSVVLQVFVTILLIVLFCCISICMGSTFPLCPFVMGTIVNAVFLGSTGLLACLATGSAVIGYFVPCLLYLVNLLMGHMAFIFNLFSLAYLGYTDKIVLLAGGAVFLVASFIISSSNYVLQTVIG